MDGDTVHSPSQHPSPCTYIGEVQAQLEFFIQPLASVIVGSCEKEEAVKQISQPSFPGDPLKSQRQNSLNWWMWIQNHQSHRELWGKAHL